MLGGIIFAPLATTFHKIRKSGERYKEIIRSTKGKILSEYSAINTGPLKTARAETFSGGRYAHIKLTEDTIIYREWSPKTWAKEDGAYWSLDKPKGSLQVRIDSALLPEWGEAASLDDVWRNQATHWTSVRLPVGTEIYIGEVGFQRSPWNGGDSQLLIKGGVDLKNKIGGGILQ